MHPDKFAHKVGATIGPRRPALLGKVGEKLQAGVGVGEVSDGALLMVATTDPEDEAATTFEMAHSDNVRRMPNGDVAVTLPASVAVGIEEHLGATLLSTPVEDSRIVVLRIHSPEDSAQL